MYALFSRLMFDSYSFEVAEEVFGNIPEPYKTGYYKYLADTFDNDIPESEFIFGGCVIKDDSVSKEKSGKTSQIYNIRCFLHSYQKDK